MGATSASLAKTKSSTLNSSLFSFIYLKNRNVHDRFLIMQTRVTP